MKKATMLVLMLLLLATQAIAFPVCLRVVVPGAEGSYTSRNVDLDVQMHNGSIFLVGGTGSDGEEEYLVTGQGFYDESDDVALVLEEFDTPHRKTTITFEDGSGESTEADGSFGIVIIKRCD